ncbi:hypothetical protein HOLleu_25462 [Holothuria leucospilota]|uniref:Uncharacterized protein n=1 Tax=Holothuria leucospilota TaxID=206669 RepID=A0A9Q1BSK9_HOLLE|nr:hypothetical protein HOLleu_25462 [Holothuria leucospilota]
MAARGLRRGPPIDVVHEKSVGQDEDMTLEASRGIQPGSKFYMSCFMFISLYGRIQGCLKRKHIDCMSSLRYNVLPVSRKAYTV